MEYLKNAPIFLWNKLIDILYPKTCEICGKENIDLICNKCYKDINEVFKIDKYSDKYFKEHLYIFKYEGKIRNLIIDYKFNDKSYLCEFFSKIIIKNKKICRKIKKYDIIIPVPIHLKRKNERGYNQSELVASKIVKKLRKIELVKNCLAKQKHTFPQSSLTKEERKQNVKQVYKVINKDKIKDKSILLFDDIYTTGSTANECAKVLKENGAKEVIVFTLAKD